MLMYACKALSSCGMLPMATWLHTHARPTCLCVCAQSKCKPIKFTCRHRAALLTDLYQAIAAAHAAGRASAAVRLMG